MITIEGYILQAIGWGFATVVFLNGILVAAIWRAIWTKLDRHRRILTRFQLRVENRLTRLETKARVVYEHPIDDDL